MLKGLKKSSPELKGRWPWNLVCNIGCWILPSLFKWWPWIGLFYGKVKFGPLCFCMGNGKTGFFINYCHIWFEPSSRWPEWQEVSVDIKTLSPGGNCMPPAPGLYTCIKSWKKWGCMPLPRGYIHVLNHEKKYIKSDFQEISLKLATGDRSDKACLLTSKFCLCGLSARAPGTIYMY